MSERPDIPFVVSIRRLKGNVLGLMSPSVEAVLEVEDVSSDAVDRLLAALAELLPLEDASSVGAGTDEHGHVLGGISTICSAILKASGVPRLNQYAAQDLVHTDTKQVRLAIPTLSVEAAAQAFRWTMEQLLLCVEEPERRVLTDDEEAALEKLLDELEKFAPAGTNNANFREAGLDLELPVLMLPGQLTQFGWSSASKRFRSSSGEQTPGLSLYLARDKVYTSQLLGAAGLPVARQIAVASAEKAVEAADKLGYPSVVKASDQDQGVGVEPGLKTKEDVAAAFERVKEHSKKIVVEEFIPGLDHRINVLNGQVVGVVRRVPGGVTGDGKKTVAELVADVNSDPRRSTRRFSVMKPIEIDDEAKELLAEIEMTPESVPPSGDFLPLRRAANVTSGGHTLALRDQIHPDNAFVCVQAAKLLNLDIAGVDLIVPDIAVSWRESGGGICEVNGMPQIGLTYPDVFHRILGASLEGDGRIPVALWIAPLEGEEVLRRLNAAVSDGTEKRLAIAYGPKGIYVDGHHLRASPRGMIGTAHAVLLNQSVDAAVLRVGATDILTHGCPVDKISAIFVAPSSANTEAFSKMLEEVRPYLAGPVIAADTSAIPDGIETVRVSDVEGAIGEVAKCLKGQ